MASEVEFYYDIACPFSYLAVSAFRSIPRENPIKIQWMPIYLDSIKDRAGVGSPIVKGDCSAKKVWMERDLKMMCERYNVPINRSPRYEDQDGTPQKLLASIDNNGDREKLSLALFSHYWLKDCDIQDSKVLENIAKEAGLSLNVQQQIARGEEPLKKLNEEANKLGIFRVPCFRVSRKIYFGPDRLYFVERELGNNQASELRLRLPSSATPGHRAKLTFYYDFVSPWSYIAAVAIERLVEQLKPVTVDVEWVPVSLPGLIQANKAPVEAALDAANPAFLKATGRDMQMQIALRGGMPFKFNSKFPYISTTTLRAILVNDAADLRRKIFQELWTADRDLSDDKVVAEVIEEAGYDAKDILSKAEEDNIKDQFAQNMSRALKAGAFGVPAFQVNDGTLIFGQDRLNIVADMLCGWNCNL
ncbi:2-hydroxychromene-2-carboxylate isomerase [Trichoplax sp. H2]|nr:2-hydroxychromene-2-carboxylate isomerase [Trichoplax sp. H2]|eukprot:RDD39657.1 2-hydroxychromene-2-carboxylate isomerase [Trichoplax sp. H2]